MRNGFVLPLIVICSFAVAGCEADRTGTDRGVMDGVGTPGVGTTADAREVTVIGCVNEAPDRNAFHLRTDRDARTGMTDPGVTAGTYELVGADVDLRQHVGQQVEVRGRVHEGMTGMGDTAQRQHEPGTAGQTVSPAVGDDRMAGATQRLEVTSVRPTGEACPPGTR
jgi:hypothetical protein